MSNQPPDRLPLEERQRLLAESAGELLRGQQSRAEFDAASHYYGPDDDAPRGRKSNLFMRLLRRVAWGRS